MTTRKITLFTAAGALVVAAGVAAASASVAGPVAPEPDGPGTAPALSSPYLQGEKAEDGPKTHGSGDCRDADCQIEIRDGDEIALDEKFGVESVKVKVDGDRVTFTVRSENSYAVTTLDASNRYSSSNYNGIEFRPYRAGDGRMMLNISRS